jgi:hypothetical protein
MCARRVQLAHQPTNTAFCGFPSRTGGCQLVRPFLALPLAAACRLLHVLLHPVTDTCLTPHLRMQGTAPQAVLHASLTTIQKLLLPQRFST